jgi:hypothetical protein
MHQNEPKGTGNRRAYRVKEAAAAYGLSPSTLYRLMDLGHRKSTTSGGAETMAPGGCLQSIKIGGRRLIPADALEALLKGDGK